MKLLRIVITGEEPPHYTISKAFHAHFETETIYWDQFAPHENLNLVLQGKARSNDYDVVFMQIQAPNVIHPETARVLAEKSLVFNWTGDVRENLLAYTQIGSYVITLFTNMTDVERMRSQGFRADYLQTGYDHEHYYDQNFKRLNNIAYCANYYPEASFPLKEYRYDCVRALKVNFPDNFNLFGDKWDRVHIKSQGLANNQLESLLYNRSLIALSVSHFDYSRYFSDRLLREMACGSMVLSHRYQDCEIDFEDNKNIVFFDDINDLIEKTNFYLLKPSVARKIAEQGKKHVSVHYTWDRVVSRFKELIKKY